MLRAEAATPKDVLVMGKTIDDMIALDPAQAYEFTDNELDGNIYRKLVMPDPKTGTDRHRRPRGEVRGQQRRPDVHLPSAT